MVQNKPDSPKDNDYIRRCFTLARRGRGKVSPNPLVGAVIVKNERIIAEGWHKQYGGPHAEVQAFRAAGKNVAGATLYCNLEPCCHTRKQTPPCTPLIIQKEIRRVVVSNLDPNPSVAGRGLDQLRRAGIEVVSGLLERDGEQLNRYYFTWMRENRPYITIKIAQSLDGRIAAQANRQTWLTGPEAVRFVHRLRAENDAVMVGANTIQIDDPQLTVRAVRGRNPLRIILDGRLSVDPEKQVFSDAMRQKTWLFTTEQADRSGGRPFRDRGISVYPLSEYEPGRFELSALFKVLARKKVTSVLVEGGADVFGQVIRAGLFDELMLLQAAQVLGGGISAWQDLNEQRLHLIRTQRMGRDVLLAYRPERVNKY